MGCKEMRAPCRQVCRESLPSEPEPPVRSLAARPRGQNIREAGCWREPVRRATYARPTIASRFVSNFCLMLTDATSIADRIYNKTDRLCTVASACTSVAKGLGRWQRA